MNRLEQNVAIITGGVNGIGKATVLRFIGEGARVAIWDIQEEAGEQLAASLRAEGAEARFYKVNTSQYDMVSAATDAVISDFGQIDILVNNAGITRDATLRNMTPEQWQSVIDVNLTGVFNCTKAVSSYMITRNYGRILNAASVVGIYGNFGQTNYTAAKAGVIGMTKVWAKELGKKGITVNAVAPGFIHTEMMDAIPADVLNGFCQKTPVGRLGKVEEVAALYAFLASHEAAFITGATISIDGGITL